MESLRTVWHDIRHDLKQGKDDLEISDAQGMYWVLITGDRLRMQHIVKRRSGAFLKTFVLNVVADTTFPDPRWYIVLPQSIYDLDNDKGIQSLSYYLTEGAPNEVPQFSLITLFRTDSARLRSRVMSRYQKATPRTPYYRREGDRLYMEGVNGAVVSKIEAKLYCNLPDLKQVDVERLADLPFEFPKELLVPLKQYILGMGRNALAYPAEWLNNDGTNRPPTRVAGAPEKTTSVNDPVINTGVQ